MTQNHRSDELLKEWEALRQLGILSAETIARERAWMQSLQEPSKPETSEPDGVTGADLFLTGAQLPGTSIQAWGDGTSSKIPEEGLQRLLPKQVLLERYRVIALVGLGGMGQVYLVFDERRERHIAVKMLHPMFQGEQIIQQLRRELTIHERLTHPNILRTYDLERDPVLNLFFVTMEFVPGTSLEALFQKVSAGTSPASVTQALSLLHQISSALDYAHRQGIVHRDLKPANILVTPSWESKLLDFGIALPQGTSSGGRGIGTAYYMAPEQLQGGDISIQTDIYALGVLAFQLLTGHLPLPGIPTPSVLCDSLPQSVDAVVAKAMHWTPMQRHSGAKEFARQLERALSSETLPENREEPLRQTLQSPAPRTPRPAQASEHVVASAVFSRPTSTSPDAFGEPNTPSPFKAGESAGVEGSSPSTSPLASVASLEQEREGMFERLVQRIDRKRPSWLTHTVSRNAPRTTLEEGKPRTQDEQSPLSLLPPTPDGVLQRWLRSQQGEPLLSFVFIPAGRFWMGCDARDVELTPYETPKQSVMLDGYWISRTPITNRVWAIFLRESGYEPDAATRRSYYLRHWRRGQPLEGTSEHPVVWLSYPVAWAFCDFYGLSLPTEAQWEKAARSADERLYPWGYQPPHRELCNFDNAKGGVCAVGQYPAGMSPYGLLDCAGNVFEWCADVWSPRWLKEYDGVENPVNPPTSATARVSLRGGHYSGESSHMRATFRQGVPLHQSAAHTGFRPTLDWRK